MMRTCDRCGARMSPFMPRKRMEDGSLVCKGCEQKPSVTTADKKVAGVQKTSAAALDWFTPSSDPDALNAEVEGQTEAYVFQTRWADEEGGEEWAWEVIHYDTFDPSNRLQGTASTRDEAKAAAEAAYLGLTGGVQDSLFASRKTADIPHRDPEREEGSGDRPGTLSALESRARYLEGQIAEAQRRGLDAGALIEELSRVRYTIRDIQSQRAPRTPSYASVKTAERPWIGADAWILVDANAEPVPHMDSDGNMDGFLWPRDEAETAIAAGVPINGSRQRPIELANPQNYEVTWANRHGLPGRWYIFPRAASLQVVAHDSGDGETIYHCPFCGAGQVVGRSDGTAECGFCSTAFTVQVQPQRAAVPQTIDGVPHVHPDMPGEPGVPEGEEEVPEEETELMPSEEEEDNPIFASKRYYLTSEGVALDEDAYIRHLAIHHADDREAVVTAVRAERTTR